MHILNRSGQKLGQPLQIENEREIDKRARSCRTDDIGATGHWSQGHSDDPKTCSTFDQTAV